MVVRPCSLIHLNIYSKQKELDTLSLNKKHKADLLLEWTNVSVSHSNKEAKSFLKDSMTQTEQVNLYSIIRPNPQKP